MTASHTGSRLSLTDLRAVYKPVHHHMTEEEKKAVESSNAAAEAAKSSAAAAEKEALATKVKELEDKLAKETRDKENYRAGLLSRKEQDKKNRRLTAEDLSDPAKVEEAIEAKIQERELDAKVSAESEASLKRMQELEKQNAELARSLEAAKTSGGSASDGAGINEASVSKPQGYWSESQRAELREIYTSHGLYSAEMIEKMILRAEQIAKDKSATGHLKNDLVPKRKY